MFHLMNRIPMPNAIQYQKNLRRAAASVASTRVSLRQRVRYGPMGSASRVQTIFT